MKTRSKNILLCCIIGSITLYSLFWGVKRLLAPDFQLEYNLLFCLGYLPNIIALTGVALFWSSGFRRSSLLRIYLCIEVISFPLWIFTDWYFISKNTTDTDKSWFSLLFISGIFITLVLFITCCIGLWYLTKSRQLQLKHYLLGGESFTEFVPASAGLRLANRLIDVAVVVFIIGTNSFFRYVIKDKYAIDSFYYSDSGLFVAEAFFSLYFYWLLEGIFNTTPGKCATNTTIVKETGHTPGFLRILGRTLCRFIPFDAFSFLKKSPQGWHDSISGTYVVKTISPESIVPLKTAVNADEAIL